MVQPAVSALHLKHHCLQCQHEKQLVFGPPMQEAVCQPPMATPPAGTISTLKMFAFGMADAVLHVLCW